MCRATPCLALVIPCYNEEAGLPHVIKTLDQFLLSLKREGLITDTSFAMYVDDGSRDTTWRIIEKGSVGNPHKQGPETGV